MCFALDMPCGASGIYLISKRSYIEWAQPIYRICASKYIDKSRTANAVRLFFLKKNTSLRASAHTGVAIPEIFRDYHW